MTGLPLIFTPLLPVPVLIALGLLALVIVLTGLIRRARGAILRALGFILLLAVLAGPRWQIRTTTPLPDIVVILRDKSPSMAIGHRTRLADAAFHHLVRTLPPATRLRVVTVTGAANDGTPLFAALHDALAAIPPDRLAGIVAITDGEATDAPIPIPPGVPVSALLAARGNQTDRALTLISAPRYGLVGHHADLRFIIRDHGVDDRGTKVPVTITVDGKTASRVMAPVGTPMNVKLRIAHAGTSVVAVAAQPLPGEVSVANDQAVFDLAGVRRRLTVLLIAGAPNPGLRTWRLLLKADPAVRLVNFTILRLPTEPLAAPVHDMSLIPFPVNQLFGRDLGKFDLIILDQFANDDLLLPPYLANITGHVRAGGALLIEAGSEFETIDSLDRSPLEPILPARPYGAGTVTGRFTPTLTREGQRDPVTAPLAHDHPGPWYRYESVQQTAGVSLLRTSGPAKAPLLILAHAGKGRVALLLSDQFWLWARGALAGDTSMAGPAEPLLRRTVHWLLGEPSLDARQLTAHFKGTTLTIERRSLHGGPPGQATIVDPAGATTKIALHHAGPGRYTATLPAPAPGVWQVKARGMTAYAGAANDDPAEQADLAATDRIFAPLADRSGGRIVWLGHTPQPGWSGLLHRRHAALVTGARDIPVPPAIPAALLAALLLVAGWWRERG
ncbi:hypothetical protein [Acidiphilium acidophilum]|uniref:Glutamine amidotransferase domain-containing protein n=1 Tax=Acidiphilium acidophilum TaxID=76588 RepID=A0AAW9DU00_ACIAO|nr:hypothetical protein [Acidiphilium acidophilum]MDX5931640.1 hypothetical protein [Acidiphilium acidophilum]